MILSLVEIAYIHPNLCTHQSGTSPPGPSVHGTSSLFQHPSQFNPLNLVSPIGPWAGPGVLEFWPWAGPEVGWAWPGRDAKPMGRAGPGRRIWGFAQLLYTLTVVLNF